MGNTVYSLLFSLLVGAGLIYWGISRMRGRFDSDPWDFPHLFADSARHARDLNEGQEFLKIVDWLIVLVGVLVIIGGIAALFDA